MPRPLRILWTAGLLLACMAGAAHAAQRVTLTNGFDLICDHWADEGGMVRLYLDAAGRNYMDVDATAIASVQQVTLPAPPAQKPGNETSPAQQRERLTDADLHPMLASAGATFDIDTDLLASVIREESDGHSRAVSRAGAQGLMQLMPSTASQMGVANSFAPGENIAGGTAYLNELLLKYHDNLPLALAAYNAGPAAVDRWHGIPPYPETRAYVARVIHEYNRRYELRRRQELRSAGELTALAQQPAR
ncbi:MAG TPA: lytic transglycosylase domain-containing protein [Acidobacteriaceae bacterium]|nr:lytic transglycosylase domain-containing protein [Acidobacteriaceae bacterium]